MTATQNTVPKTSLPRAMSLSEWWPALNRLLVAEYLEEASFGVARPYFEMGCTPEEAFKRESAIQARMIAA